MDKSIEGMYEFAVYNLHFYTKYKQTFMGYKIRWEIEQLKLKQNLRPEPIKKNKGSSECNKLTNM